MLGGIKPGYFKLVGEDTVNKFARLKAALRPPSATNLETIVSGQPVMNESNDEERASILRNTEEEYRLPNLHQIVPPEHLHAVVKLNYPKVTG